MAYSQKYSIVQFVEPVQENFEFSMDNWPLHVTLADVFAVELNEPFMDGLASYIAAEPRLLIKADNYDSFGDGDNRILVTMMKNNHQLQLLHDRLIDFLEQYDTVFNSPQFTRKGFVPHATYQNGMRIEAGREVSVEELSLIDMYVDGDWRKRKLLRNFKLNS